MSNSIELLERLKRLSIINEERMEQHKIKKQNIEGIDSRLKELRYRYQTVKFTAEKLSEYYIQERDKNLENLSKLVGDLMTNILQKPYEVKLKVVRRGNYDYLEKTINGIEPEYLSGGEKQAFSLAMITETITNGILILDETINSIHSDLLENVVEYLDIVARDKQVILIELDSYLNIIVKLLAENNTIRRLVS